MIALPYTRESYDLLHEGAIALAEVESHGMKVDVDYLKRNIEKTKIKSKQKLQQLESHEVMKVWRKTFRSKTNLESNEQLGHVLFNVMGYKSPGHTAGSTEERTQHKTDEESLAKVDDPFVHDYLELKKITHASNTYLKGILREVVDDTIHCFFNLHTTKTFRSCIAKGTLIEVVRDVSKNPKGIPIEDVHVNDLVYCYDDNKKLVVKKVLWAGKTGHRKVIRLHWIARGKHGHLDLTPEHKVRLANGNYVRADALENADFRKKSDNKHGPKTRTLAMGRNGDRIWETGSKELVDHRLIYENIHGPIVSSDVIHHKDGNHLNNTPTNLEKTNSVDHAKHHAPEFLTKKVREKARVSRIKMHKKFGDRWKSGQDHHNWVHLSKFEILRLLSKSKGKISRTSHSFSTVRDRALLLGIDLWNVKDRYDVNGGYISIGRLKKLSVMGRTAVMKDLGVNFYKLKRIYDSRGVSTQRRWGNQFGHCTPNNHKIVRVQILKNKVDVYDLEVEDHYNFIANEICVHNSSDSFNFQNLPIRDPAIAKLIRRAFVAREGRQIVEIDFSGAEVRVAACYHKDPRMMDYINDPTKDMHRDMSMQCYMLPISEVTKAIRHSGKNQFVFPQFYGDWYQDCARAMWDMIDKQKLMTTSGIPLKQHLKEKGIERLGDCNPEQSPEHGTFEHHIQKVEQDFWKKRFKVYNQWKFDWYEEYKQNGYLQSLTGFICQGFMKKNEVINYPIQGSAFHCLLWSLIRIVRIELKKRNMKTLIVGQIHDSIVCDVVPSELQEFLAICKQVMIVQLQRHWKWLIVPIEVEVDVAPVGGTWFDKQEYKMGVV